MTPAFRTSSPAPPFSSTAARSPFWKFSIWPHGFLKPRQFHHGALPKPYFRPGGKREQINTLRRDVLAQVSRLDQKALRGQLVEKRGAPIARFLKVEFALVAANLFDGTRRENPNAFALREVAENASMATITRTLTCPSCESANLRCWSKTQPNKQGEREQRYRFSACQRAFLDTYTPEKGQIPVS